MARTRDVEDIVEATAWSPVRSLSRMGVRSGHAYTAGLLSIGVSLVSWLVSRNKKNDSKSQSDRWGIFIGQWAPTFIALGVALKSEGDGS